MVIKKIYRGGWLVFLLLTSTFWYTPQLLAQKASLRTGQVLSDETQAPLPGVNILVKGTESGKITDEEGKFAITASEGDVLVFSFVGYQTQEIRVSSQVVYNVLLKREARSLGELVVTGYSTERKKDITGSVSVVNVKDLKTVRSFSAEQALQGMASGVNVTRGGAPGAASRILIRGISSFGDTNPLVIVDGIQQNLNNISANDIESIQILKDAGAAAIYGVRGANGVIIVTTRKGKRGAPVVSYDANFSMQYPLPGNPYNLLDPDGYMTVFNQAYPGNATYANGLPDYTYRGPSGSGVAFEGDPAVDPSKYFLEAPNMGRNYIIQKVNKTGTDWFHEMYKPAPSTEHNLSISGGTDKSKYLFGLGYLNQQGTLVKSYLKRYSIRLNTEFQIGNYLKVGENVNLIHRDLGAVNSGASPYSLQSMVPVKDIMGNWAGSFGGPTLGASSNPVANQYRHQDDINNQWNMLGNVFAELTFLKDLVFRTSLGYNINNSYSEVFSPTSYENAELNNAYNSLTIGSGYDNMMTFTNTLNYKRSLAKHSLGLIAGTEAIRYQARSQSGTRQNFYSDDPNFRIFGNGQQGVANASSISKNSLFSIFGRLDYSFDDRYLVSATARRDGSSRFGPGKKYGIFPSVSLGWRISQEDFMKEVAWINELKLRGSYGVLGSQNNVDPQNQYSLYYSSNGYPNAADHYYDLAGTGNSALQGFAIQRYGNTNTGWEEDIISNVGLDAGLFNNALEVTVEYYKKSIRGLLFTESLPAVLGDASAPQINIGNIQNTGFDFNTRYRAGIAGVFNYTVGLNVTTYRNRVIDIQDPGYFDAGVARNQEGHPVSSFFGYRVLGIFNNDEEVASSPVQQAAAPGRFRYEDADGDGTITPNDRVHLGSPNPDFTYGISLLLEYKHFDFSAYLYGSKGNQIYNDVRRGIDFVGFYPQWNKSNRLLNAWTPDNQNTTIPKIESAESFSTSGVYNSYFIENGSFLKLRTLTLGYTLNPQPGRSKVRISQLRLYGQAANVFTLTKYSGLDPEIGGSAAAFGIDSYRYPTNELNLTIGLSVTF